MIICVDRWKNYKAQRQIHSAMMGDTPEKTVYNRQYIDNISAYDSELQRISKSVCHKLDLGPISLPEHNSIPLSKQLHYENTRLQYESTR